VRAGIPGREETARWTVWRPRTGHRGRIGTSPSTSGSPVSGCMFNPVVVGTGDWGTTSHRRSIEAMSDREHVGMTDHSIAERGAPTAVTVSVSPAFPMVLNGPWPGSSS
jgi:hypothetical protein